MPARQRARERVTRLGPGGRASSKTSQERQPMAKQFRFSFVFRAGNVLMRSLLALGISVNGTTLITVPGRKTGRPRSTPITMVEVDGQRYVQSPFGDVDWVRNLRAAGKATLSWGRRHETISV